MMLPRVFICMYLHTRVCAHTHAYAPAEQNSTNTDFQLSVLGTGSNFILLYFKLEVALKIGMLDRF